MSKMSNLWTTIEELVAQGVDAQRIDWLVSGDDDEKTFHERLPEDLAKIH